MVFEDFVVPDPLIGGGLLLATLAVAGLLTRVRPPASPAVVLGFAPWMVLGGLLHVLHRMHLALDEELLPGTVAALLSAPSVYLTTFLLAGLVWAGAGATDRPDTPAALAVTGTLATLVVGVLGAREAGREFALDPVFPLVGLVGSLALAGLVSLALAARRPDVVEATRSAGALVIFAHVFDALTTAIGVELLDAGERSTAPQFVLDLAAALPTADLLGVAWLFVLLKVALAVGIVVLFHEYVDERPGEGALFLGVVAAVGLGPGAHNFFLFAFGV